MHQQRHRHQQHVVLLPAAPTAHICRTARALTCAAALLLWWAMQTGWTPLHYAAGNGRRAVQALLAAGADKEAKDNVRWAPPVCCQAAECPALLTSMAHGPSAAHAAGVAAAYVPRCMQACACM